jgi:hypothetical protein
MSRLEFYNRPLVAFDPANKEHRRWFHEFMQYGEWGHCPVRFICPDDIGYDLTVMIRNELIDYYVKKEFKTVKKVDQKLRKMVDNRAKR